MVQEPDLQDSEIRREVVARARGVFPAVERILLFGSRARGDARADSDYDVLVVVPDLPASAARATRLRLALRGLGVAFDIVVLTPGEFAAMQQSGGWWPRQVLREAVVLHEAA